MNRAVVYELCDDFDEKHLIDSAYREYLARAAQAVELVVDRGPRRAEVLEYAVLVLEPIERSLLHFGVYPPHVELRHTHTATYCISPAAFPLPQAPITPMACAGHQARLRDADDMPMPRLRLGARV